MAKKKTRQLPFPKAKSTAPQAVTSSTPLKKVKDVQALVEEIVKDVMEARVNPEIQTTFKNQYDTLTRFSQRMEAVAQAMIAKGVITEDDILTATESVQVRHAGIAQIVTSAASFDERVTALNNWNAENPEHPVSPHDVEIPMLIMSTSTSPEDTRRMCDASGLSEVIATKLVMYAEMQNDAEPESRHIDAVAAGTEEAESGDGTED